MKEWSVRAVEKGTKLVLVYGGQQMTEHQILTGPQLYALVEELNRVERKRENE